MRVLRRFYVDGLWVEPSGQRTFEVVNPATEQASGVLTLGDATDADRAVRAARDAFPAWSQTSVDKRVRLLERLHTQLEKRRPALAEAVSLEMGAPDWLARGPHIDAPAEHLQITIDTLRKYEFAKNYGPSRIELVPIGVCALITPWNFPVAVSFTKLLPALAVGCTVVLKPSEYSPYSAQIIAEMIDDAGYPAGVFNLIQGDGPVVGAALSSHPQVDLVSITGSTRAGIEVARNAATTIKRVHQELGGKSPNVLLPSADIATAVGEGVEGLMFAAGQSCSAPARMIAPRAQREQVLEAARRAVEKVTVGAPDSGAFIGPVVNASQWKRIQELIQAGIDEGATVVGGGVGRPDGLAEGFYVRPTVLADVKAKDTVAQQEIFGPVLVIQFYDTVDEAVDLANDTPYGLASYIQGSDLDELHALARRIPAGQVYLNGNGMTFGDNRMPFGGLKASGNGRERGEMGFEGYLEPVAILGYNPVR